MNDTEVLQKLRELGIGLRPGPGRDRLVLPPGTAHLIPPELVEAIRENYDELLRGCLLREELRKLGDYMVSREGIHREHPSVEAAYSAMTESPEQEVLDEAFVEDLDTFTRALDAWVAVGEREFERATSVAGEGSAAVGEEGQELLFEEAR